MVWGGGIPITQADKRARHGQCCGVERSILSFRFNPDPMFACSNIRDGVCFKQRPRSETSSSRLDVLPFGSDLRQAKSVQRIACTCGVVDEV